MLEIILIALYAGCMLFILLFCINQFALVVYYLRRKNKQQKITVDDDYNWPAVTVQLPIFNELYVVERLIDAMAQLDYPKGKLEIQVLDDSTDESLEVSKQKVAYWQEKGIDIKLIRRFGREGFKAGALQYGLELATGDFTAVFDADFVPHPDFLKQTVPYFQDESIGMVQTRWGHLNKSYSLLTRVQAFALDAHFSVEQGGRNLGGFFMNFNGTAGVWRKQCIIEAGGWQSDTLTEDLDLSYRAQLAGWRFKFLEEVTSPAELPAEMNAIKSQQYRWNKGGAEVARKMLPSIFRSSYPFKIKLQAFFHLISSSIYLFILFSALLSLPLVLVKHYRLEAVGPFFDLAIVFMFSLIFIGFFYFISFIPSQEKKLKGTGLFVPQFLMFMALSMGMSLHNSLAVASGWLGQKTPFIRTPKFNIKSMSDGWKGKLYVNRKVEWLTIAEGFLTLYFLLALYLDIRLEETGLFIYHLLLFLGFGAIFFLSVTHAKLSGS